MDADAKADLRAIAYRRTAELTGKRVSEDGTGLEDALRFYTTKKFNERFHFNYENPTDKLPDPPQITTLFSVFEQTEEDVTSLVNSILSKFSVPSEDIQDQLRVDLRVSAAGPLNGIGGAWRTLTIDRDYILANQPPLKLKANLIYYRSVFIYETESGGNATSSIAYAFFFGTFYRGVDPGPIIPNDLLNLLLTKLREAFPNIAPQCGNVPLAVGDIQALAERCAKVEFAKEFLYEFSGNRTLPIGSIPGEPVTAKESFQRVSNPSHTDVTQKLQDWVDGLISRGDEAGSQIRQSLFTHVKTLIMSPDLVDNNWIISPFKKTYPHPSDTKKSVQARAILLHVKAHLVEGLHTADEILVYYAGVDFIVDKA